MRSGSSLRFYRDMSAAEPVQLTLAIDPASEPITGAICDRSGKRVEFSGWLGFASALEELLGASRPRTAATAFTPVAGARRHRFGRARAHRDRGGDRDEDQEL